MKTPEEFWAAVKPQPSGCWEWQGYKDRHGYPHFRWHGKIARGNRIAWELTNGPIPKEACVLHRCDNPPCVNPDHLFLGTPADNARDMKSKGRQARGERNGMSKLNEDDIREIRTLLSRGEKHKEIANQFGVDRTTITHINISDRWAWAK